MSRSSRNGGPELTFAARERNLALYLMRVDVMAAVRDRLVTCPKGEGCFRFSWKQPTDLHLVDYLVRAVWAGPRMIWRARYSRRPPIDPSKTCFLVTRALPERWKG